jgi:hypothetical protein
LVQPERVAQPPQVISPGPHVPELGAAVITAAATAQVEVHHLKILGQRSQRGLHRHVIQAGTAVDRHHARGTPWRIAVPAWTLAAEVVVLLDGTGAVVRVRFPAER